MYVKANHLGNVRAVVAKNSSGACETVSYTDYYPHGGTMPGRNYVSTIGVPFAYQGIEKDKETNLLNFELRQYDARLGRWYNPDPMGQHHSPYLAMSNNPISSIDPTGGVDFYVDDMKVSEMEYNAAAGGGNVQSFSYGGLGVGTNLGYSYDGQSYLGKNGYKNALGAQQTHWGTQGIINDGEGNYYQKYNFALSSNYGNAAGGAGFADVTDMAHAVLARNHAEAMYGHFEKSAKFAKQKGDYAEWFEYKAKMLLGEDFDSKFEKAAQPYAQMIADLNPLMNAGHIISGIATGENAYGSSMKGGDYAWAAIGIIPGGAELKEAKAASTIFQKHHIIPNAVYKSMKSEFQAMGWAQNGAFNLKKLPTPFHGNHPAYNSFVKNEIMNLRASGSLNLNSMGQLQQQMRIMIGDAYRAGGNLNDYFKIK